LNIEDPSGQEFSFFFLNSANLEAVACVHRLKRGREARIWDSTKSGGHWVGIFQHKQDIFNSEIQNFFMNQISVSSSIIEQMSFKLDMSTMLDENRETSYCQ